MTSPKCQISTLELLPCDNYWPVTIFWPCPEAVTISDKHCIYIYYVFCRKFVWPTDQAYYAHARLSYWLALLFGHSMDGGRCSLPCKLGQWVGEGVFSLVSQVALWLARWQPPQHHKTQSCNPFHSFFFSSLYSLWGDGYALYPLCDGWCRKKLIHLKNPSRSFTLLKSSLSLAFSLSTYLHDNLVHHSEIAFLISCEDGRREGACIVSLPSTYMHAKNRVRERLWEWIACCCQSCLPIFRFETF